MYFPKFSVVKLTLLSDRIFLYTYKKRTIYTHIVSLTSYKRFQITTLKLKFRNDQYRCYRHTDRKGTVGCM